MYLPHRTANRPPTGDAYLDYIMKERLLPISAPPPKDDLIPFKNDPNPFKSPRDPPLPLPAQPPRSTTIAATPNAGTKRLWMPPAYPLGCEATFLGIRHGSVHLRRTDNILIIVPAAALSLDDLAYIEHNTGASMAVYRALSVAESRRGSSPEGEVEGGRSSRGGGQGRDGKGAEELVVEEVWGVGDDDDDGDGDEDSIGLGWEEVDDTFGDQDWPEADGVLVEDFWTPIS